MSEFVPVVTNAQVICDRSALVDGGKATRFTIEFDGRSRSAFVVSFAGGVFGYVNACPHRGTELDWQPGEVFDESQRYLICATHAAQFEPNTGLCVDGPCVRQSLQRLSVNLQQGQVVLDPRSGRVSSVEQPEALS